MNILTTLMVAIAYVQGLSSAPETIETPPDVKTFRASLPTTSARRARAALAPKYAPTALTTSSALSSNPLTSAQSKATSLVTLNRAKRSSQYVPEDINDKATWKRNGIATAAPWDRAVGGWDKRPDWKPKSTWDGTNTRITGGDIAGTATSGRQTFDVKHPNLVTNGKISVKRR